MGKSSGGSAPGGSQTIIQDIAEPFKGFATRSLERSEQLGGLPSVPFTGVATAGPTPDELVAAQALRQRFLDADPLSEQALGLQATAADPITAQSIEQRRNPFNALIAQEAYRRLDERGQRGLQDLRAREVAAGGTDRGRGAVEASLFKARQEDQERQIGLEAGQRSFTEASRLAEADRQARGDTSVGLSRLLTERQALQRRDIDDLLKVGAQFREQFIQPELDLERRQFVEERGPASVQNPFGFEQFFSGIRSAAPTPTVQTTQNFKQTPSGLSQAAPIIGAGVGVAGQFVAEGGEINFDKGGIASFRQGRQVQENEQQRKTRFLQHVEAILRNPEDFTPEVYAELKAVRDEFLRQRDYMGSPLNAGALNDRMRYLEAFETGLDNIMQSDEGQKVNRSLGRRIPRDDTYVSPAQEEIAASEMRNRAVTPQALIEAGQRRFDETRMDRQAWLEGERERRKTLVDPQSAQWSPPTMEIVPPVQTKRDRGVAEMQERERQARAMDTEAAKWDRQLIEGQIGGLPSQGPGTKRAASVAEMQAAERAEAILMQDRSGGAVPIPRERDFRRRWDKTEPPDRALSQAEQAREADAAEALLPPHPEPTDTPPEVRETIEVEEAPPEYWAKSVASLPEEPEEQRYDNADITAMMQFQHTGRGRERLPKHLMHLAPWEMADHLKPIREKARKASEPRRKKERLERINNRTNFNRRNSGGIGDTGSFEFSDIADLLDFNKGGVASFKEGGIGDLFSSLNPMEGDPITKALFPEQFEQLQQLKPRFLRGGLEEEEEEISPLQHVENYQESQRQAQRRGRTRRNKRGRRKIETGLSSLNQGGIASFDKGGTLDFSDYDYGMGEEALEAYGYSEAEPESQSRPPSMLERLTARAMLAKRMTAPAETDQYYPDRPEMTSKQQWQAGLSALSKALMAVKADPETGITDFSDVGQGISEGGEGEVGKMEARRTGQIAARRQQQQDTMKALTDLQGLETSILASDKVAVETKLAEFELAHPEYAAATQAMSDILRNLPMGEVFPIEQFTQAVNQMKILMGSSKAPSQGIIIPQGVIDARVNQKQEK